MGGNERQPPGPVDDDEQLLAAARRKDPVAFEALVRGHQARVIGLARRILGPDGDDAEDVAQQAFVRAHQGLDGFRGDSSFSTWIWKIAVNLALNHRRGTAPRSAVGAADDRVPLAVEAEAPGALIARDRQRVLREAVARLPKLQRLVVELRIWQELPFREIAAIADTTEDSAKASFTHALKRLRELLGDISREDA